MYNSMFLVIYIYILNIWSWYTEKVSEDKASVLVFDIEHITWFNWEMCVNLMACGCHLKTTYFVTIF